ncbi:sensor histidine kinase [Paracoccus aminophilus]|uniref:histidine kinase n=1 Tax=Paracoccus aminophilus JCM 7686 TaxID=1367847 RepID=S5Y0V3_PARAH|nr:sensor histidine kinase [Paracoccus aminophilus]AGT11127.1 two-component system, sensor histidine kinase [Paracoccus aminophilus JCM 7686]
MSQIARPIDLSSAGSQSATWAASLFENNPAAILIVEDDAGRILAANGAACQQFRLSAEELRNRRYGELLSAVSTPPGEHGRYQRADGTEFRASVSRIPMDLDGQAVKAVTLHDETSATEIQESLTATLHRLQRAQEITECGCWDWNIPDNLILLSRESLVILGLPPGDRLETPIAFDVFLRRVHPDDRSHVLKTIGEAVTAARPFSVDYRILRAGDEIRYLRTVCELQTAEAGIVVGFFGTIQDMTLAWTAARNLDRQRLKLERLTGHLQNVREEERKRISRELHDQLGQLLTVLRMGISWVQDQLPPETAETRRLAELKQIADTTVDAVRRIIADLRPSELNDLGLVPAVSNLLESLEHESGIAFCLDATEPPEDLSEAMATGLFRLIQEACTNIVHHAQARTGHVSLDCAQDKITVTVADDGIGMQDDLFPANPDCDDRKPSFGILGMRERVRQLHGSITFQRSAMGGASVAITVPFAEAPFRERSRE